MLSGSGAQELPDGILHTGVSHNLAMDGTLESLYLAVRVRLVRISWISESTGDASHTNCISRACETLKWRCQRLSSHLVERQTVCFILVLGMNTYVGSEEVGFR